MIPCYSCLGCLWDVTKRKTNHPPSQLCQLMLLILTPGSCPMSPGPIHSSHFTSKTTTLCSSQTTWGISPLWQGLILASESSMWWSCDAHVVLMWCSCDGHVTRWEIVLIGWLIFVVNELLLVDITLRVIAFIESIVSFFVFVLFKLPNWCWLYTLVYCLFCTLCIGSFFVFFVITGILQSIACHWRLDN